MNYKPQLRAAWQEKQKQEDLKKQYGIKTTNVVVVERKNIITNSLRLIIKAWSMAVKVMARLLIVLLAIVGLATFIYPNIREELFNTIFRVFIELKSYF